MPRTRRQRAVGQPEPQLEPPVQPPPEPSVEPNVRSGGNRGLREPPLTADLDLELEDKSLHLVGGCYGTWDSKRGFQRLTNFRMEPGGFISSKKYILKGDNGKS